MKFGKHAEQEDDKEKEPTPAPDPEPAPEPVVAAEVPAEKPKRMTGYELKAKLREDRRAAKKAAQ